MSIWLNPQQALLARELTCDPRIGTAWWKEHAAREPPAGRLSGFQRPS